MFVAWRDLRFAKGRFALMATVIVLMTMLVGLLSGLTAGLARDSTSAITDLPADHLVFSQPGEGEDPSFTDSTVDRNIWRQWAAEQGVTSAAPLGVANTKAATDDHTTALSAFGVEPGSPLLPEADRITAGNAVLSTEAAEELSARSGDIVTVNGQQLRVSTIAGDASYSHMPVIWTNLADWQRMTPGNSADEATVVALSTNGQANLAAADQRLNTTTLGRTEALSGISSYTSENSSLQMMRGFLFAISALVVGAFFMVWTIQRSSDIAVLKALGATTGYLLRDALGQAVILLVGGTVLGTAIAAGLGAAAANVVPFVLDASTVLIPALIMIVLGAMGAALSVRRITSVDPLTALGANR